MQEGLKVLVIDADAENARELSDLLRAARLDVSRATSLDEALTVIDALACDVVMSELSLPGGGGPDLVKRLCERYPEVPIVLVTSEATGKEAMEALRAGALDLLFRPLRPEQLSFVLHKATAALKRRTDYSQPLQTHDQAVFGDSHAMQDAVATLRRAAASNATVLVRGESGTGKELFARAIHDLSGRAAEPFVKIDCTSLPENLLESELFGYEKGAFTGAVARKPGRVELADRGTLFLDEIGELPSALQAKLLRLLQDREFERLGATRVMKVDVRVVAATHRDLETMTERGQFRQDLFYRLNVVPLWLPPLRARRSDIDQLARHFCARFAEANGKRDILLDPSALSLLREQRWPGNVRQLQNFVERLVVLNDGPVMSADHVREELSRHVRFTTQANTKTTAASLPAPTTVESGSVSEVAPLESALHVAERRALVRALKHAGGNRSRAARMLGVSRSTLYVKLQEHDLL
ncbi:MAG TPA: sigma-54 dependent transcriptional regulator [Polyangiaceae bacterium]